MAGSRKNKTNGAVKVQWRFWIENYKYDEEKAFDKDDPTTWLDLPTAAHNELWIKTADLKNGIDSIKINNVHFVDGDATSKDSIKDNEFADELTEIRNLLTKYQEIGALVGEGDITKITQADIDILESYQNETGNENGKGRAYDFTENSGKNIEALIELMKELVVWRDVAGLKTVKDVLRANANGFRIVDRGAGTNTFTIGDGDLSDADNLKIIKEGDSTATPPTWGISDGKYRGFNIYDRKQERGDYDTAQTGNKFFSFFTYRFYGVTYRPSLIYTRDNIDNFRKTTEFDGKSDPQDCRGFQPGDLTNADNYRYVEGTNTKDIDISATGDTFKHPVKDAGGSWIDSTDHYKENEATKRCFQIVKENGNTAPGYIALTNAKDKTFERVIELAFTNNFFDEVKQWGKKDSKTDITAVELLEKYYIALKANPVLDYKSLSNKKISNIDKIYQLALEVAQLVDENPTDQASYESWEKKFEAIILKKDSPDANDYEKDIANHWGSNWINLKNEKEPSQPLPPPTGNKPDDAKIDAVRDEVVNAATGNDDFKELLKKIFEDNRTELKKEDEAVLDNLKELAKLIDKAYKNGNDVKKSQLEVYSKSTDANQQKAWKLANKVVDKNNKKLGENALSKANKPEKDKKTLDETKNEDKTALGDEAYNSIIEGNNELNTPELVEKVVEIFKECKKAWQTANGTDDNLKTKLEGFKTNNDKEWKAINKYQFDNSGNACPAGYTSGALTKLTKAKLSLDQLIKQSKLTEVTDQASFDAAVQLIKNAPNFKDIKDDYENLLGPRGELLVALSKDSDDDKKAAYKLIAEFMNKFEKNYSDSDYATELTKLEGKLEELKKYQGKKFYQNLDSKHKETFDTLVTNLENKIKLMKEAQKKAQGNNQQTPNQEGDWKTWYTVALVALLLLILAGVAYYFLGSKNEEETEE